MKASLFSVVAGAVVVAAQNLGGQPACALPCLPPAIAAAGCALTDVQCQCGPRHASIQTNVAPCLLQACNATELRQAQSAGEAACASVAPAPSSVIISASTGSSTTVSMTITAPPSSTAMTSSMSMPMPNMSMTTSSGSMNANYTRPGVAGTNSTMSVLTASTNPSATRSALASSATANITASATAGAVPARAVAKGVLAGAMGVLAFL